MTRSERTEQMLAHIAAREQSGKSRKAYCEQHGLNLCVLNYWCAKLKRETTTEPRGFAEVEMKGACAMELHYPNGVRLLLPAHTASAHIAACIRLW
jgi:hypothetical protein